MHQVVPVPHISLRYPLVPLSMFAQTVVLQLPISPPLLSWLQRALRDNDLRMASYLQAQQSLAQLAVQLSNPEPCLLSTLPLHNIAGLDRNFIFAIEERMRVGATVELDSLSCLGPSFTTENSPKMYYDVALTRTLLEKAIAKGRIIPWPPGGPLPHFVSALSVAFRFVSSEQKRSSTNWQRSVRLQPKGWQSKICEIVLAIRVFHDLSVHYKGRLWNSEMLVCTTTHLTQRVI